MRTPVTHLAPEGRRRQGSSSRVGHGWRHTERTALTQTTDEAATAQTKRVNVNFALPTYERLKRIADRKNITVAEALRQAIALTDYIETATMVEHAKVYIDRGKGLNELIVR